MGKWPEKFLSEIKEILHDEYDAFLRAMDEESLSVLRINPRRENAFNESERFLSKPLEAVQWENLGYYADSETRPGASLLHAAGAFYMQDASAMSPVAVLAPRKGERILDLCAAPGGKSGQIAAHLGNDGFLLSNEIEFSRAKILASNLERLGITNVCVTSADSLSLSKALPEFFDAILVDAPCSGEGMFRRDIECVNQWSEGSPAGCAQRQAEILDNAAKMVRPGGRMVYSTCTFNRAENENTIAAFLERHSEFEAGAFTLQGVGESVNGTIRLWPHKIRGEGHFAALLIKKEAEYKEEKTTIIKDKRASEAMALLKRDAVQCLPDGNAYMDGENLYLLPLSAPAKEKLFAKGIRVVRFGMPLAKIGKGFVTPEHTLAMALSKEDTVRCKDLTAREAIDFMAGEEIHASSGKGWTLMTYKNMPIGWGKASGDVIKNHLPKGLRKRGGHWSDGEA